MLENDLVILIMFILTFKYRKLIFMCVCVKLVKTKSQNGLNVYEKVLYKDFEWAVYRTPQTKNPLGIF